MDEEMRNEIKLTARIIENLAEEYKACPYEVMDDFMNFVMTIERVKELFDVDDEYATRLVAETWKPCYA